jgi:hypothetical protein
VADAAGSGVLFLHLIDGVFEFESAEYSLDHAHCMLFAGDCGLCHDLEEHLGSPRSYAHCWLHHHRLLCTSDELDGEYGHGKCGRGEQEELYGCQHLCFLLCWQCTLIWVFLEDKGTLTCIQIVGPQLVKSQTLKRHYPELWLGIIIR